MLNNISNKITGRSPESATAEPVELTPEQFKQLVLDIAHTQEIELACESTHELLDEYADLVAGGQDAEILMPMVKHHMGMCPDCRDEYETLLEIVQSIGA
jgi:hypothetical protein